MSPELEVLLRAEYERHNCDPTQRADYQSTFNRLLNDALAKRPGTTREEMLEAIRSRMLEFRRAQKNISTIPPKD